MKDGRKWDLSCAFAFGCVKGDDYDKYKEAKLILFITVRLVWFVIASVDLWNVDRFLKRSTRCYDWMA